MKNGRGQDAPKLGDTSAPHILPTDEDCPPPSVDGFKTFWEYSTRLCLRHIGAVTVVLSKKGEMSARSIRKSWWPIWTS